MSACGWVGLLALAGLAFGLWQLRVARSARRSAPSARDALHAAPRALDQQGFDRAQLQFIQSERLEAVGRLAGGVAHDFNNMLGVIVGNAERARAQTDDSGVRARLDRVVEAAQHAAALTRQLLAFSRRQVLEPRVLDLNALILELEPALRRLLGEKIVLITRLSPALARVRADPAQIGQILLNLAANARAALPRGGRVAIDTRDVELDEAYAREHVPLLPGAYVELRVSDDGDGMEASAREHVFEPFFGGGSGLGLCTVYGIVKQSRGYVWVESAIGQGTAFTIQLPREVEAVAAPAASAPVPAATRLEREGRTILVVEDQEGLRSLICEILEDAGYRVLSASSGPEALSVSAAYQEAIDLVVTDVIMPSMSGTELLAQLGELRPQTRALLISGYTPDAVARSDASLPYSLLRKPFTGAELLEHVGALLAGQGD